MQKILATSNVSKKYIFLVESIFMALVYLMYVRNIRFGWV